MQDAHDVYATKEPPCRNVSAREHGGREPVQKQAAREQERERESEREERERERERERESERERARERAIEREGKREGGREREGKGGRERAELRRSRDSHI